MDNRSLLFPGIRFQPTDEELVLHYLHPKVFNSPLRAAIILEIDNVSKSDPWDLPGDLDGERYFFSTRELKNCSRNRCNRATLSAYWKPTGKDKKIAVSGEAQHVVGMKKTLVFYKGKAPNGSKTDWIMHEYCLADAPQPQANWVLCRIFLKKRGSRNGERSHSSSRAAFHDFFAVERANLNLAPTSSSSSRSSDHQES